MKQILRHYYGFEYACGRSTTTGNYPKIKIAGTPFCFDSIQERDEWVAKGQTERNTKIRDAVTLKELRQLTRDRNICADNFDYGY
jgi:hypothetical protein